MGTLDIPPYTDAPAELRLAIEAFWPEAEHVNAAQVAYLESGWSAFAVHDTRTVDHPCGSIIGSDSGVPISAEYSIGYFQINACDLPPDWTAEHLFNGWHNAGTAHDLWSRRGWEPWFLSATALGLI